MTFQAHIAELTRQHYALEKELTEVLKHNSIDDLEIVGLKRQKLQLKDKIERLRREHAASYKIGA